MSTDTDKSVRIVTGFRFACAFGQVDKTVPNDQRQIETAELEIIDGKIVLVDRRWEPVFSVEVDEIL